MPTYTIELHFLLLNNGVRDTKATVFCTEPSTCCSRAPRPLSDASVEITTGRSGSNIEMIGLIGKRYFMRSKLFLASDVHSKVLSMRNKNLIGSITVAKRRIYLELHSASPKND